MYDAIIVGARCAGSPTAMNLARKGHRVLVLDRARFPSDTLSTHALTGDSLERIRAWGLLDRLMAAGSVPVRGARFHCGETVAELPARGGTFQLCPRRTVLDNLLVEAAREAGAEVREGFSVRELLRDGAGNVVGITGTDEHGEAVREEARVVIGADGRTSFVAKEVGAEEYHELPALTCGFYSYFEGFEGDYLELHFAADRAVFVFPTNNGQHCLAVECKREMLDELRKDVDGAIRASYEMVGLGDRYAKAHRVENWHGALMSSWYYRKPYGPGWALVGDAGYLKDPILGMGINDAFRDADALAAALDEVFSGRQEFDAAMAGYQQQRDTASLPAYQVNYEFSKLNVTPELVQMLAVLASAPAA